jgi:hypothetical protein
MLEELIGHVHACCKWLESIDSKLANQSSGVSSVNIKTSTRGHDIDVKAYTGSPITEAGDTAVAEYFRVAREIEARLMGQA